MGKGGPGWTLGVGRWMLGVRFASSRGANYHGNPILLPSGTGSMNVADFLLERCRWTTRDWPKGLAEILELLMAAMDDEGPEIMRAAERWLQSDDIFAVRVALEIEGVYPFLHRAEMEAVLAVVKARWPELSERCDERIRDR